jgi:hypothetical protein
MSNEIIELCHFNIGAEDNPDVQALVFTADETDETLGPKHIGFFTTEERAWAAAEKLKEKEGFRDWPGGFRVFRIPVDVDFYPEGFDPNDPRAAPPPPILGRA